jgi:hypothetical protein
MAIFSTITCNQCHKQVELSHSVRYGPPSICHDCARANEEAALNRHLKECAAKPLEERLRAIEEQLYHVGNTKTDPFGDVMG